MTFRIKKNSNTISTGGVNSRNEMDFASYWPMFTSLPDCDGKQFLKSRPNFFLTHLAKTQRESSRELLQRLDLDSASMPPMHRSKLNQDNLLIKIEAEFA